jgi:hypothetical protein
LTTKEAELLNKQASGSRQKLEATTRENEIMPEH